MSYMKAEDILPEALLRQLQQYVDGRNIYIPRKPENRRNRDSETEYQSELRQRNHQIRQDREQGLTRAALAEKYHLSEKSISRILREGNR